LTNIGININGDGNLSDSQAVLSNATGDARDETKKRRLHHQVAVDGLVASDCMIETGLDDNRVLENILSLYEPGEARTMNASAAEQHIEPTLVMFKVHIPPSSMLDGVHAQHFFGTGVVVYHSTTMGLVAVDKNTVAISVSDVMLAFAAYPMEIPAEVTDQPIEVMHIWFLKTLHLISRSRYSACDSLQFSNNNLVLTFPLNAYFLLVIRSQISCRLFFCILYTIMH
jgi:hypothetical protein